MHLTEEKLVTLNELKSNPENSLRGIVRVVDSSGHSFGLFLDNDSLDKVSENWLVSDPEFINLLDKSRNSGRVSSNEIKKNLNL